MAFYETVFVARQDLSPAQVEELASKFIKIIEAQAGKLIKKEAWGLRTLAYPIKKNKRGHYTLLGFEGPGQVVPECERQMRIDDNVIRYLTVRVEEMDSKPSVMMARIENRETREQGDR